MRRIDADALIRHLEAQQQAVVTGFQQAHAQFDAAGVGELNRVIDQDRQHLAQPPGVAAQEGRQRRIEFQRKAEALGGGAFAPGPGGSVEQQRQGEVAVFDRQRVSLQPGHVEYLVHHAQQLLAGAADRFDLPAQLRFGQLAADQVAQAEDGVQGRAQFVARGRQEGALGQVRGFGRVFCQRQLGGARAHEFFEVVAVLFKFQLHRAQPQHRIDATWPLTSPGVPSIRMLHNHFIVFDQAALRAAPLADADNPNLTDGGQNSLFQSHMGEVYRNFFAGLEFGMLEPCADAGCRLALTGYPQGLPSWKVSGGAAALKDVRFWREYDMLLKGFIDFYRCFFSQVSTRNAPLPGDISFPALVEERLQFNNDFLRAAKKVRDRCITDARYANAIRWQPAFKQLLFRNDPGELIVTISQNSIGNAITELLGVVVRRVPDADAYGRAEPALIEKLLAVRRRLVEADLGEGIATARWGST